MVKATRANARRYAAWTTARLHTRDSIRSTSMHDINKLRVFQQARKNVVGISEVLRSIQNFGDIRNQIQRASISVVSNIAEGAGSDSNK